MDFSIDGPVIRRWKTTGAAGGALELVPEFVIGPVFHSVRTAALWM